MEPQLQPCLNPMADPAVKIHICTQYPVKVKLHYAILVTDRSKAGRRPAASWNLAYRLARC